MTEPHITDLPASVRARLSNVSAERGQNFQLTLMSYAIERLVYRLVQAGYGERFVLKGAALFGIWFTQIHRPTHDLDLLGFGDSSAEALTAVFREICAVAVEPDGLVFDAGSIRVTEIREDQEYGGQRVRLLARLANARIPLQVDIGFGDVLVPAPDTVLYPSLLGFPTPRLQVYHKETVVAEKLHAMIEHGSLNSRMKDFYDLWVMCRRFAFDGCILSQAVSATFGKRGTRIAPEEPLPLSREFAQAPERVSLWQGFLTRHEIVLSGVSFADVVAELNRFLMPIVMAVATGKEHDVAWPPGGPWTEGAQEGDTHA